LRKEISYGNGSGGRRKWCWWGADGQIPFTSEGSRRCGLGRRHPSPTSRRMGHPRESTRTVGALVLVAVLFVMRGWMMLLDVGVAAAREFAFVCAARNQFVVLDDPRRRDDGMARSW